MAEFDYRVAGPTIGGWKARPDEMYERMLGSLRTALDHGHTSGSVVCADDDGTWTCWLWHGPVDDEDKWIVMAVGDGSSESEARALAAGRLEDEIQRWATVHAGARS